jgi:hypothetical protein
MINYKIKHDDMLNFINSWSGLPEVLRKSIFKAVHKVDPTFLEKLADGISGGFTLKKVNTWPATIFARLDNLTITTDNGKWLRRLVKCYFIECNLAINESFKRNFNLLIQNSPEKTNKQITEKVLIMLQSEFQEDPLLELYKKALPVCEPIRFTDDLPDHTEFSTDKKPASQEYDDEQIQNDVSSIQNITVEKYQDNDVNKRSGASQNMSSSNNKSKKLMQSENKKKKDIVCSNGWKAITVANIIEVVEEVSRKLKAIPMVEAENIIKVCQTTINSLGREYKEYSSRLIELDHQLTALKNEEMINFNLSNEAFFIPINKLAMSEATDKLLQGISQTTAILDKYKRIQELEKILSIVQKSEPLCFDKPNLGEMLSLVDIRCGKLEKLFNERVKSEALLNDFVARLESCDYAAAKQFVSEIKTAVWENIISAALLFQDHSGQTIDDNSNSKTIKAIATRIMLDPMLLALISSVVWQKNSDEGLKILSLITEKQYPTNSQALELALSGLTFEQLQMAAAKNQYLAKNINRLTLLSALAHHSLDVISWLHSFSRYDSSASIAEMEFIKQCVISHQRGSLVQDLSTAFGFENKPPQVDSRKNIALKELQSLTEVHGLGGHFRKLRESAREHYILPVMFHVKKNQAKEAIKLWNSYGDYQSMIHHVVQELQKTHRLEQRHINKTIQYLQTFSETLGDWVASVLPSSQSNNDSFISKFHDFIKVAGESDKAFRCKLRAIVIDKCSDNNPPLHFGRLANEAGKVSKQYVEPIYIENWIIACNSPLEETDSSDLLAERLIHILGQTDVPQTHFEILEKLLTKSEFLAAADLLNSHPDANMITLFTERVEEAKKITLKGFETEWRQAHSIALVDENVQLWTSEIESLIDEYRFSEVRNYLPDLSEAIQEYKNRNSDEYRNCVNFLREANKTIPDGFSLNELRNEINTLKKSSIPNRQHILCLENVLSSSSFEDTFKSEIKKLLNEIDHPATWLPLDRSNAVLGDLKIVLNYLESRSRWRDTRPETYFRLSYSLARFIAKTVEILSTQTNATSNNNELGDLATWIALESWEADEVLKYLHEKLPSDESSEIEINIPTVRSAEKKNINVVGTQSEVLVQRPALKPSDETTKEMLIKLHRNIFKIAEREKKEELPKEVHTVLRSLCRELKWHKARLLSANILCQDSQENELRNLVEATYCVALAHDNEKYNLTSEEMMSVCLGTIVPMLISKHEQPFYYTDHNSVMESVVRAFLKGLNPNRDLTISNLDIRSELVSDLSSLIEKPASDTAYRWLMGLFHEASVLFLPGSKQSGSTALASVLWDQLTGDSDPAKARSNLLLLCFNLNLIDDVIVNLAKTHASPYDYFVIQFLRAVKSSEANETAWDEARRLAQSFIEQVPVNKIKPWRVIVNTLNKSRKNESYQDQCSITLENCSRKDENIFMFELCILPGPYSILESAQLYVGDDTSTSFMEIKAFNLIAEGDQIASRKIERITINLDPSITLDHLVTFPYRFVATTTAGINIDQRDRWIVNLSQTEQPPLPKHILLNLWKGADGNPVDSRLNAYHGRKKESKKIDELLSGDDGRQRSALIIGQRRIGKTSLLVETLRRYPPKEGHVCAVYSQFGGIQKRKQTDSLSETIFNSLTEIDADIAGYNDKLCKLLSASLGNSWLKELRKGLNPATSIGGALKIFVDRVAAETKGFVKRMAFFADEFQAVFKYPPDEVDQVMWGLRPLVQMSPTISLVFAGSGITRGLTQNYDKAFFGSITTLDLTPFSIEDDYDAIADTFLPEEARQYLCPNLEKLKPILQEAFHLTGGHPWYLSMLGRSSATQLQGRVLTPMLLKEVAQKMVIGDQTDFYDKEIGAAHFYGHLFDSLDSLGKQKAYSQLVLANIARQVTLEWPWLTAKQAISGPKIEQTNCKSRDCLDALRILKDEQILDHKLESGVPKYRIRIPLVAEAIRYDADEIEYQAADALSESAGG